MATEEQRNKAIEQNEKDRKAAMNAGSLKTAAERLGFDKVLYKAKKKKELFTGTTKYLDAYNDYMQGIRDKVNNKWNELMKDGALAAVPYSERAALADEAAESLLHAEEAIANTLYPGINQAYLQQSNLNAALNTLNSNIANPEKLPKSKGPKTEKQIEKFIDKDDGESKSTITKKKGRPRKTSAEKKAAAKARAGKKAAK